MEEEEFIPVPEPYILCAAVYFPDNLKHTDQPVNIESGFVVAGRRHGNCYYTLELMKIDIDQCKKSNEGFLTSDNRFLNRQEAVLLAKERNQLILIKYTPEILTSENLYYP